MFTERSERSGEGELISVTINSGVVKASELDRKDNSSNDKSNYKKVEVGDIAYNSMRMWQGASGYSSYEGILSPAYTVIIPKNGVDSKFFAYDFKRYDMIQTFKRNSQGLTSDTWNLKFPTLKSVKVSVPCIEEQMEISIFFEKLDNLITLHQRKHQLLINMKKSYLGKIFPKNDKDVPEIRFAPFTDAWEQRKLDEVIDVRSGRDYKHLNEGDIPVYGTGGYMLSVDEALSYDEDAIGIGRKGTIDKPYLLKSPFWTVDTLFYAIPKKGYDLHFMNTVFQRINWKSFDESTGVPSLSKSVINNVISSFPNRDEQRTIGNFFQSIDDTITFNQSKIEQLKNIKKSLLNKMFI